MIKLSTLDGREYVLNAELIESIESTPETVILLTSGKRVVVRQSLEDVLERVIAYKQQIFRHRLWDPSEPVTLPEPDDEEEEE